MPQWQLSGYRVKLFFLGEKAGSRSGQCGDSIDKEQLARPGKLLERPVHPLLSYKDGQTREEQSDSNEHTGH
jgi:hypothetical protein